MGYLHIDNLYKDKTILMMRECYALEKVHGTSTHVMFRKKPGSDEEYVIGLFSGGCDYNRFRAIFDFDTLMARHAESGLGEVTVYGEGYGGKMQAMSNVYGPALQFIAFDVKIGDRWLSVPQAEGICAQLGFEFVPYERVSTDLEVLDAERDRPSVVAQRRGIGGLHLREGVVLRPLIELTKNNGNRIIAKHKHPKFGETRTHRALTDDETAALENAGAITNEWVTPNRLENILSHIPENEISIEATGRIIKAMIEDVEREAGSEIVSSPQARRSIGKAAAKMFKDRCGKQTLSIGITEGE